MSSFFLVFHFSSIIFVIFRISVLIIRNKHEKYTLHKAWFNYCHSFGFHLEV